MVRLREIILEWAIVGAMDGLGDVKIVVEEKNKGCNP